MDYKAEEIKPYNAETDKTTQVREMFDSIAPAYDAMNRTMTVGIDRWWRRVAVKMLRRYPHRHILAGAQHFAAIPDNVGGVLAGDFDVDISVLPFDDGSAP